LLLLVALLPAGSGVMAAEQELPELGDSSSAIISPEAEREIGHTLARQVRAQVPTIKDPLLKYYTDLQLYRLAEHSDLKRTDLTPVLIDSPEINAFAAPGGVVGINLGLYTTAEDVHEYSAVIAHELAHLSQRHFARGVEMQRRQTLPYLAAMLASIVVAATVGGDAGLAAISSTQAAAQANQLRYSRGREQEADRIGIDTLEEAGLDPTAMARMFERMQRAYRYTRRPPEFLLTHPVSETRIADARNQAAQLPPNDPKLAVQPEAEFELMRARAIVHFAQAPEAAVQQFRDRIEREGRSDDAIYGLAIALAKAGRPAEGIEASAPLFGKNRESLIYAATEAELLIAAKRAPEAIRLLQRQLAKYPDNQPLSMLLAEAYEQEERYDDAQMILTRQSVLHPSDHDVWYELAETAGLAGDIIAVHQARAEYFGLVGALENAVQHLEYARTLADPSDTRLLARLDQRIRDFREEMASQLRQG
jgi:predicted Zn-dependent protease